MPKPLTPDQLTALRAVPLGAMPNKLRIAMALAGANQIEICDETGYAAPSMSRLVTGRYQDASLDTCRKIAGYFGCAIEDLFPARQEVA